MISIFDDDGKRQSVTWNGVEFNDPTLTRDDASGFRLESIGFSTPTNFQTEPVSDIVKNGGGVEFYNPHVGTRVLNLRGNVRATKESTLNQQLATLQRAFHPLYLQSTQLYDFVTPDTSNGGLDQTTTASRKWPTGGFPSWVRGLPLKFTRVMPETPGFYESTWATAFANGKLLLEYHVAPLALPDPVRATAGTGMGADFEAQFLILDGGRSFDQDYTRLFLVDASAANIPVTWGRAPSWPLFLIKMDDDTGDANFTITIGNSHMGETLVLDLSGLSDDDEVVVDTRDRTIWLNNARNDSLYVSGDYPIIADYTTNLPTLTVTNTTNVDAGVSAMWWRESDYF